MNDRHAEFMKRNARFFAERAAEQRLSDAIIAGAAMLALAVWGVALAILVMRFA